MSLRPLRMPPRIKVLEAASALGGGRVRVIGDSQDIVRGVVASSDGTREYQVILRPSRNRVFEAYSTDNGTRLRGYIGYPIIAVMMHQGVLPRDSYVERVLSNVPWRALNERFKKYSMVERYLREEALPDADWGRIEEFRARVLSELRRLRIYLSEGLASP